MKKFMYVLGMVIAVLAVVLEICVRTFFDMNAYGAVNWLLCLSVAFFVFGVVADNGGEAFKYDGICDFSFGTIAILIFLGNII